MDNAVSRLWASYQVILAQYRVVINFWHYNSSSTAILLMFIEVPSAVPSMISLQISQGKILFKKVFLSTFKFT